MKKVLVICTLVLFAFISLPSCKAHHGSCDAYHHPAQVMMNSARAANSI